MTEIFHLRCNRCGKETSGDDMNVPEGWARVAVDMKRFHFCPECWEITKTVMSEANMAT